MERILAIDPGREKCGMALVESTGEVVWQRIVPAENLLSLLGEIIEQDKATVVVMGDRTGSAGIRRAWKQSGLSLRARLEQVDEHMSSVEGRKRYLHAHRGRGLARFLPISLRSPDKPFDDFVAVVLAERYLAGNKRK